jgi:hypothetical protein
MNRDLGLAALVLSVGWSAFIAAIWLAAWLVGAA